jgi:post-segregation antitoxin (ccd killing protein)
LNTNSGIYLFYSDNNTTLTLDDEVVNRATELGINLSAAAERGIIDYIKEIESIRSKRRKSCTIPVRNEGNYEDERRGGDLNSCGAGAPRAFQARAVPV